MKKKKAIQPNVKTFYLVNKTKRISKKLHREEDFATEAITFADPKDIVELIVVNTYNSEYCGIVWHREESRILRQEQLDGNKVFIDERTRARIWIENLQQLNRKIVADPRCPKCSGHTFVIADVKSIIEYGSCTLCLFKKEESKC